MPSAEERKKAVRAFKEKAQTGGLYRIVNESTGWKGPVQATVNLDGMRNRFQFAQKTRGNFDLALKDLWADAAPESFSFAVLDQLERKPEQTASDFRDELDALLALWREDA